MTLETDALEMVSAMRVQRVELWEARLPLVRPFRTSSSLRQAITHVVMRVEIDGVEGWGECAAPVDPYYCEETSGTCWLMLTEFLVPAVLGRDWVSLDGFRELIAPVKGNRFAKAGLEAAVCVALARGEGVSLARWLGGTRTEVESGVSLGIEAVPSRLIERIEAYLGDGYRRIKLKIAPGNDVEVVRLVRERFPEIALQVDANSAYTLADVSHLEILDEFGLLLIEQPLGNEDIVDHARLQRRMKTPLCLDESLRSVADVRHALDIDACRVVNIKAGRVGGLIEARAISEYCRERGVPVWCGGMHEFGIGRAANVALASLAGFTLAGDVSGSSKYFSEDVVDPPITASRGRVAVPEAAGLGVEPVVERIERAALRWWASKR